MTAPFVFDVTARDFDAQVVARSREVPVLLDFWAEWCGPCRTLGPILEKLGAEYGGGFLVGKVDTEREQELSYAFQVQGIPFCVLMVDGQPVDAFTGALPEPEIRRFLDAHGVRPKPAAEEAPVDTDSPAARLDAGRLAAARGDVEVAQERLGGIPEEDPNHAAAQRILDGLDAIATPVEPANDAARALLDGRAKLAAGDFEGAAEAFLQSATADKALGGGLARRSLVLCFELMALDAGAEEQVASYRRRLATLLY